MLELEVLLLLLRLELLGLLLLRVRMGLWKLLLLFNSMLELVEVWVENLVVRMVFCWDVMMVAHWDGHLVDCWAY